MLCYSYHSFASLSGTLVQLLVKTSCLCHATIANEKATVTQSPPDLLALLGLTLTEEIHLADL